MRPSHLFTTKNRKQLNYGGLFGIQIMMLRVEAPCQFMNNKYALGWVPDVPDVRDVPFAAVFRVPRRMPAAMDLRAGCSPVEDQGALGSCTAQALVGGLEYLQLRVWTRPRHPAGPSARHRDLSRLFLYYNTRALMGTIREDSGAMLRTGLKSLRKTGVCGEDLWPYLIERFAEAPPRKCYQAALACRVQAYQRLASLAEMKACLAEGLPFVFGFAVYEHVMDAATARTGRIRLPRRQERMLGGHAVLAVGYRDRDRTLIFRNSWGAPWGDAGYGEIPYAYLESRELSDDFWCIQSACGAGGQTRPGRRVARP